MLPSHNCIIIINVQFSRYIFEFLFKRLNEASSFLGTSVNPLLIHSSLLLITLRSGGPKWTRTIDLTIISRVLSPAELLAHFWWRLAGSNR